MKKFRIVDGNWNNILGGDVEYENVFISMYPVVEGVPVAELAVGEGTNCRFDLGIPKGNEDQSQRQYRILRVE